MRRAGGRACGVGGCRTGTLQWVITIGGPEDDSAGAVVWDPAPAGPAFVVGSFQGQVRANILMREYS